MKCEKCGAKESLMKRAFNITTKGKIQRYLCRKCNTDFNRKYRKTNKNKNSLQCEASKRSQKKYKIKVIARAKVRYAVLKGNLIKPKKCKVCENKLPLQGHHGDYQKPLEVIWLCSGCHADADKLLTDTNPKE